MGFSVLGNGSIMSPIKVWRIHLGAQAHQKLTFIRLSKSISFKSCFHKHIELCIIYAFSIGAPSFRWVFWFTSCFLSPNRKESQWHKPIPFHESYF